jgi:toxin-antitoxin system PIN domain toxin
VQLLDVNIVVAAHRRDHPHHAGVRPWFDRLVGGQEPFTVPTIVWGSFLRLVTHRRVFEVPTPLAKAFAFIDATCAQPHHLHTSPGTRHLHAAAALRRGGYSRGPGARCRDRRRRARARL